jgi:hypothetical protein
MKVHELPPERRLEIYEATIKHWSRSRFMCGILGWNGTEAGVYSYMWRAHGVSKTFYELPEFSFFFGKESLHRFLEPKYRPAVVDCMRHAIFKLKTDNEN